MALKSWEIKGLLDEYVILNQELLALGKFMQKQTISPLINCYSAMLPSKLKPNYSSKDAKNASISFDNQTRSKVNKTTSAWF